MLGSGGNLELNRSASLAYQTRQTDEPWVQSDPASIKRWRFSKEYTQCQPWASSMCAETFAPAHTCAITDTQIYIHAHTTHAQKRRRGPNRGIILNAR